MWSFERATETEERTHRRRSRTALAAFTLAAVAMAAPVAPTGAAEPARITVGVDASQPNGRSELPATNADGSVIVFKSLAANLIAGDRNGLIDVFVFDRVTGTIERVPRRPDTGNDPLEESFPPVVSADGRFVAFGSAARNLVRGDFNLFPDAYRHDRATETTANLSLVIDINSEGRLGGRVPDIPLSISADGRFVSFTAASAHIAGVDTNETHDVFVYDAETGSTELISVTSLGSPSLRAANDLSGAGVLSPDGNFVAFCSEASNLTRDSTRDIAGIFVRDRAARQTFRIASLSGGNCLQREMMTSISDGAGVIAFVTDLPIDGADNNNLTDVYVWFAGDGRVELVSRNGGGQAGNGASSFPALSGDGRFLTFQSSATDLVDAPDSNGSGSDVFVVDLTDGRIERVTGNGDEVAAGDSLAPSISRDGTVVVFQSNARLTADDTNAFPDIYSIVNELSFTPTPTETATATETVPPASPATAVPSTPTRSPTQPIPTATVVPPTPTVPVPTPTTIVNTPTTVVNTPTPVVNTTTPVVNTPTPSSIPATPASTPTGTSGSGGGGGGDGCGCRIDPVTGQASSSLPLLALLPPALLLAVRRRRVGADLG